MWGFAPVTAGSVTAQPYAVLLPKMGTTTNGPGEFIKRVMSVLWLTPPLVAVTCAMKVPVDAVAVVVNSIGELASPPAGGVTVCGTLTLMPVGALPTQDTENVTGELKPPREFTTIEVPPLRPGMVETVSEDGATEKSGIIAGAGATGARTVNVPEIVTGISVE